MLCGTAHMYAVSHSRHICRVARHTCLLCHTAEKIGCVAQQTCLLRDTADSVTPQTVSHSRHTSCVTQQRLSAESHSGHVCFVTKHMSAVRYSRHDCGIEKQTCAVSHSRHVCCVRQYSACLRRLRHSRYSCSLRAGCLDADSLWHCFSASSGR